jgi:hypothetical protein
MRLSLFGVLAISEVAAQVPCLEELSEDLQCGP